MAGQYYCKVHQGDEITLLTCPSSFEVYKTMDLALQPYSLQNSGQSIVINGVRKSLEVGKEGRLTFVQNFTQIRSIYYDPVFGVGLNQIANIPVINVLIPKN